MDGFERLFKLIPDAKGFVEDISSAVVEYPSDVMKTVRKHVQDEMLRIDKNCIMTNSGKFKVFIGKFLYVQVRSQTADKAIDYLYQKFDNPNDLSKADPNLLSKKFRQIGYRFPEKAEVIIEISKILRDQFGGKLDNYIAFVDNEYFGDPVLKVKGVGFKTRDIALSSFTKKYSLADVHIVDVLSKTGLILNAYIYGFKLTTDRSNENDYLEITKLLNRLSSEAKMMPYEFDQTLWYFGKDYCSRAPRRCKDCLTQRCVYRDL